MLIFLRCPQDTEMLATNFMWYPLTLHLSAFHTRVDSHGVLPLVSLQGPRVEPIRAGVVSTMLLPASDTPSEMVTFQLEMAFNRGKVS